MNEIKEFLEKNSKFPGLYHDGLEVQILVAQDEGEKKGKGFTDGIETWSHQRISKSGVKANLDHVEAIGMSGWNYLTSKSEWVGYDFDSLTSHKKGLTDASLKEIIEKAKEIPWIEIRKSTSGKGCHLYCFLTQDGTVPEIQTRRRHILLSRAILRSLSGLLGFDFKSKVDGSGGILWQWHRKGNSSDSFKLLRAATEVFKSFPKDWEEKEKDKKFKGQIKKLTYDLRFISLDEEQLKLLKWLSKRECTWWWDAELNMLVTHTFDLMVAHKELEFKGVFFTEAKGTDCPNDQNCFAFPIKNGAWIIRRHNPGTKEHPYWKLDKGGWTYCYLNKIPTLEDLANIFNGSETDKGDFIFSSSEDVISIIKCIAPTVELDLPDWAKIRDYKLKQLKNSKLSIKFTRQGNDPLLPLWIANPRTFEKVIGIIEEESELIIPDNIVRHVVTNEQDAGWYINSRNQWVREPKYHINSALVALNYTRPQAERLIGQCVLNPWTLTARPFESEYPGNRQWNKYCPQLQYEPKEGDWSEWGKILNHLGKNLDTAITKNSWCVVHAVMNGFMYLKYWVASVFQNPMEPLPYLFLYGPQLSGKSSFHEALDLLVNKGVVRADVALTNPSRFNAELAGAIIGVIEETNLRESKLAYNRIKDWVTSRIISIHEKGKTPFELLNTTHWIQCANKSNDCPIQFGDTRIVIIFVDEPEIIIPKEELFDNLKAQAPAFIYELLNCDIPPAIDRLRIPVLETEEKREEQEASANPVEQFIIEKCFLAKGYLTLYSDFCAQFRIWVGPEGFRWTNIKIGRSIPLTKDMPIKGRAESASQLYLGNLSLTKPSEDKEYRIVKKGDRLVKG